MAIYGSEITTEDLQQQFMDEVANEVTVPDSELVNASFPEFQTGADENANDIFSLGDTNGIIPSGIPNAIDKLWKYNNRVPDIDPPVSPVLKLKNKMDEDYTLSDNFNGICVELNTIGHRLIVEQGSTIVAL